MNGHLEGEHILYSYTTDVLLLMEKSGQPRFSVEKYEFDQIIFEWWTTGEHSHDCFQTDSWRQPRYDLHTQVGIIIYIYKQLIWMNIHIPEILYWYQQMMLWNMYLLYSPFIYGYFGYLSNTYQEGSDMIWQLNYHGICRNFGFTDSKV